MIFLFMAVNGLPMQFVDKRIKCVFSEDKWIKFNFLARIK